MDSNIFGFNCSRPNYVISHGLHYSRADLSGMTELVLSCLGRLCNQIGLATKDDRLELACRKLEPHRVRRALNRLVVCLGYATR